MGSLRIFSPLILIQLVLGTSDDYKIRSQKYRELKGFNLSTTTRPVRYNSRGRSTTECSIACLEDPWCRVFSYDPSLNSCQLIDSRNYSVQLRRQDNDGFFYAVYEGDTWFLMFSAKSETGVDIYGALMGTADLSPWFDCEGTSCDVFRSPLIDVWDTLPIGEVKFVFYGSGKKVLELRFEGRNSTKENWFSVSRLLQSPWTDLDVNRSVNFFSVRGHPGVARYFYISYFHDGCPGDRGWMALINTDGACGWEVFTKYPVFLYSTAAGSQVWNSGTFNKADHITISAEII